MGVRDMKRRGFIGALGAALFAPAVIRTPGLLMPVKALEIPPLVRVPTLSEIVSVAMHNNLGRLAQNLTRGNFMLAHLQTVDGAALRIRLPNRY